MDNQLISDLVAEKAKQARRAVMLDADASGPYSYFDLMCEAMDSPLRYGDYLQENYWAKNDG